MRRADDPLILDSVQVIDALLKVATPSGPAWYRYNGDGYGEHDDGAPFDGVGCGRAWPLLTGERVHYELALGKDPLPYLEAMAAMSSAGGMIPEQVWDGDPIPGRGLYPGRPTWSAMPLVWAHAEYIKLVISRQLGHPHDRPQATWQRYKGKRPSTHPAIWLPQAPIQEISVGQVLLIGLLEPCTIHWGMDGWQQIQDTETRDTGLGLYVAELDTQTLQAGQHINFTFQRVSTGE